MSGANAYVVRRNLLGPPVRHAVCAEVSPCGSPSPADEPHGPRLAYMVLNSDLARWLSYQRRKPTD